MRRRGPRPDPLIGRELEVTVGQLGSRGDGIASTPEGPLYVAGAAPGDRLVVRRVRRRGDGYAASVVARRQPGPDWQVPECPHFNECGGCAAQHLKPAAYAKWKRGLIENALRRRDLRAAELQPLVDCGVGNRRRGHLHARHVRRGVDLGFYKRDSEDVVDIAACMVLRSSLVASLPATRAALRAVLPSGRHADVLMTEAANGLDLLITGDIRRDAGGLEALAAFARDNNVVRLSWRRQVADPVEPLIQAEQPLVDIGGVPVAIPAGAFLQAAANAERQLAQFIAAHLGTARHILDLYAGIGAFSLPLAHGGRRVHAVDINGEALKALAAAAGRTNIGGRAATEVRDLNATPIQPKELNKFDAVVFDPPRAGALAQSRLLAGSDIPRIVAISCEPGTFARDAEILVDGGYRLETILPVDQFVYSSKLEIAASFVR